jgi:hypothetical protein
LEIRDRDRDRDKRWEIGDKGFPSMFGKVSRPPEFPLVFGKVS